jgi:hypothetical protein
MKFEPSSVLPLVTVVTVVGVLIVTNDAPEPEVNEY